MLAIELIDNSIAPLNTTDTIGRALARMSELKLYHLPIVNDRNYLGLVAEEELMEGTNQDASIASLPLLLSNSFVYENAHVCDVIQLLSELKLSVVPVLDLQKNFVGVVSINKVLSFTGNLYAINAPGGIIVLSVSNVNNSLAHMSQIVEANNAQVLSSYVSSFPDSTRLEVTLKINKTDLTAIVASFERYEYEVKGVFNDTSEDTSAVDRYDSFMNYLNV